MIEEWRPINKWEGLYEVSNLGRVRSIDRIINGKHRKGQVLALSFGKKNGYLNVGLSKKDKTYRYYVHRLVAESFIPNPNNLSQVNHKDENKKNNFVFVNCDGTVDFEKSNLEWCTQQYNLSYGTLPERRVNINQLRRNNQELSKPVIQYDKFGKCIAIYLSLHEAERVTGIKQDKISKSCRKKNVITTGGYIWRFKENPLTKSDLFYIQRMSINPVIQCDSNWNTINEFKSSNEAARQIGCNANGINLCCRGLQKTCFGFKWKRKYNNGTKN